MSSDAATGSAEKRRAIIVVDHGSKLDSANDMLNTVVEQVRSRSNEPVYPAHMDMAEPSLRQAFATAVAEGAEFIFIFPYFLSPGRHSREDIPKLCAAAAADYPTIEWHCAGPIGPDPIMAELIWSRVQRCESDRYNCNACPDRTWCEPPSRCG